MSRASLDSQELGLTCHNGRGSGVSRRSEGSGVVWRPMIRLVPVLLLMAAVAGGAVADPACLPDCNGENLIGRDLRFANMAGASLRGAALTIANAARADLSGADLSFANLARADLEEADLSEAKLYGATLAEANMEGANLSGADLFGASLIYADLVGANLTGADLRKRHAIRC